MAGRGSIGAENTLRLWVVAGGRCEYRGCNRYLLEDDLSGYRLNLAERSHVVGATPGERSPRGEHDLAPSLRDGVENLMLLCRSHHRVIDRLVAEHSVQGLLTMKREHEQRVRLLTGLGEDVETVVVRVIGGIRGAPVEIGRHEVEAAVRADRRFPRYRFGLAGEDFEIDLRNLPDEGSPAYWAAGERIIAEQVGRLRSAQSAIRHLSLFALARIPLLVALGFHLDDKIPTAIYQRRRNGLGDRGWGLDLNARPVAFGVDRIAGPQTDDVSLAVSLTAPIGAEVAAIDSSRTVYEMAPISIECSRDVLAAQTSLDSLAETYHRFLATVERDHPGCREIQLFLAAPAAAAIILGRGLMRESQPTLLVHDRDANGVFQPALILNDRVADTTARG